VPRWRRDVAPYHGREAASERPWRAVSSIGRQRCPPRCLAPGESWKDQIAVGSPKNLLPRADPGPIGSRPASGPSGRPKRMTRLERWHARRLDRLAERVERRRGRLAVRWEKITRQRRREGLVLRVRHRWYLLTERIEPLTELLLIRWYRFVFRVASHWRRTVAAAGLSVALAVAVVALVPLGTAAPGPTDAPRTDQPSAQVPSTPPPSPSASLPSSIPTSDLSTYANGLAGYLFSYPSDWDVSTSGTATILSDPQGRIEISFDGAPAGSLQQVSDDVLGQLTNSYGSPQTIATEVNRTSQGYPSIAVGGIAYDETGVQIRFLPSRSGVRMRTGPSWSVSRPTQPPRIWMPSSGSSTRSGSPGHNPLPRTLKLGHSTYDFRVRNA
jgi:hypothetical protein